MTTRLRRFSALLAAVGLLSAAPEASAQRRPMASLRPVAPEQVGFDPVRLQRLDAALNAAVSTGQVAGVVTILGRRGRIADVSVYGQQSLATGVPMAEDSIHRIYSMTKPVTGVAMMILFEEGRWRLDDPVTKYVPEFAKLRALKSVDAQENAVTEDLTRPPTMRELMTHTAGFGYGLSGDDPVNKAFRDKRVLNSKGSQAMIDAVAGIPLLGQPGKAWRYSVAVDVQGYIVERLSGQTLDAFMADRIFKPLKMTDTAFQVPAGKVDRFAAVYAPNPSTGSLVEAPVGGLVQDFTAPPGFFSGGGGLVSTASDYARFCQMLLNGGELDGSRILAPASVKLMSSNQLTEGQGLDVDGRGPGTGFLPGVGFGLDFAVVTDPAAAGSLVGEGTVSWGGAAGTWFWVDPASDLFFVGMIQRFGGSQALDIAERSRTLVYQALTDPAR